MTDWPTRLAIVGGTLYLLVLGVAMTRLSYDIWGAFVVGPIILVVSLPILARVFNGPDRTLFWIAVAGLFAKIGAAMIFYWVAFDAYGGAADPARYHAAGRVIASNIRDGLVSPMDMLPRSQGTPFIEELTGLLYAVFGSSLLGGFMLYAWMSFWGAVLYVRAAMLAVPGLFERQYAALVFLLPSIVLWSSTTGKEAPMMLFLGLTSYGIARLSVGRWAGWSIPIVAMGAIPAAMIRPHFSAMWIGAMVLALIAKVVASSVGTGSLKRLGGVFVALLAVVGLVFAAQVTLRYLDPSGEESGDAALSDRVTTIFEKTEKNTTTGGSRIEPVSISGPQDWPIAIVRTLTRPLPNEARSFAEMLPAAEMTVLFLLAIASWRRLANLPAMLRRCPYVVFAVSVLVVFGLAWASFGNLGLLVRQRSLVTPLLVLLLCLPARAARTRDQSQANSGLSERALSRPTV